MLVLSCSSKFFLIHKKIENWDFLMLAEDVLPNFSQFSKELENWDL